VGNIETLKLLVLGKTAVGCKKREEKMSNPSPASHPFLRRMVCEPDDDANITMIYLICNSSKNTTLPEEQRSKLVKQLIYHIFQVRSFFSLVRWRLLYKLKK